MRYPVVLLDLFRTVLTYTPQAPTGDVKDPSWRAAMGGLRGRAAPLLGGIEFDFFVDALYDVSVAIARARPPHYLEVSIEERYARALARLGCEGPTALEMAKKLAALQLEAQAANTECAPAHAALLRDLAAQRRLALVSNFDHAATGHALLARHGLDRLCAAAVFSIEAGHRKPHPSIFEAALRRLDAQPQDALFIGDSFAEDIRGAGAVGMDTVWVNWHGAPAPDGPQPTYTVPALVRLRELLADDR